MTRLKLFLILACATGAAATLAATSPVSASRHLGSANVTPDSPRAVAGSPAAQLPDVGAWLSRYGTYNVIQGSWNFLPSGDGC